MHELQERIVSRLRAGLLVGLCVAATGCLEPMRPGEYGTFRFFEIMRGEVPLPLAPPHSDRNGNVYVLYGNPEEPLTNAYVGRASGGWFGPCNIQRGDTQGVRGWVGHGANKAWYWTGNSLVKIEADHGNCAQVLANDPRRNSEIFFRAVFPWVRDAPSRTLVNALIDSPGDTLPFQVVVDLENEVYTVVQKFFPEDATQVTVLGVGAEFQTGKGFLLVKFMQGASEVVEGRILDVDGTTVATAEISGATTLPAYGVAGFLQVNARGRVAGIDKTGRLVTFNGTTGSLTTISSMQAVGVHPWKGELYVVGNKDGVPVIALLDDEGNVGEPVTWTASQAANAALAGTVEVLDDRIMPRQQVSWIQPVSAMGGYPFVHAHAPDRYGPDMTGWLIAGPSFPFSGSERQTSVAFAPVGISYP